ncbi:MULTISPECIES: NADP-dependent oxidoreductase [Catenuloplanes]|uniref:NADPH:quinone reductase-like Zn-dependent oxidoreductase n=1 Tax=Catenuloplanes niger TaxID=587534 RepID=A0AAE4CQM7_9ACTN|nr:NADP-dependent oxidoreductase [Catenuloplanes niger]MDR7320667.1 NADPH:quinone reductase-like Zn-dependent oxidoreductase [Catenuloplanes niger]
MKRLQYDRYGGPEVMRLAEFTPPRPGPDEVLVRVRAAASNALDWKMRNGEMKLMTGRSFPRAMGHDFAGVVQAVGAGVTRLKAGDAVLGAARFRRAGAFADVVTASEKAVVLKPVDLSYEQAAALPTVGVTAYQATVDVRPGQAVFVNGCLGGVGRAAVQFARARGASVAGSCRDTATDEARALGVDPVVGFGFDPAALAARFDLVFDTPGMLPLATARTLLKPGGTILDIVPTPAKMIRSALPGPFRAMMGRPVTADLEEMARTLRLPVARTVPLSEAILALTELERDKHPKRGKLVITMAGS